MKQHITFFNYVKSGIACAIAYCIPLLFFFKNEQSKELWILYLSNIAFMIVLLGFAAMANNKLNDKKSIMQMFFAGLRLALAGIIITIPFVIILFILFGHNIAAKTPSNDNFIGIFQILLLNVVMVNFFVSCFAVLLAAVISEQFPKNSRGEEIT
jgi:MFS family permease